VRGLRSHCLRIALAACLGSAATAARAQSLAETIRRVKPSVVGVGSLNALRRVSNQLEGTGFIVGDGSHAVTNHHVVARHATAAPPTPGAPREYLIVFVGSGRAAETRRAQLVASDPAHDTALLRFEGEAGRPLRLWAGETLEEGRSVAFTGYPIGNVLGLHPVTHRGIVSAVTPIAIPQLSTRLLDKTMLRRLKQGFDVYQLDATAYPGNSGSPLYDPESGDVLGIVSSVFVKQSKEKILSDPTGITFAIPIRYARELLARTRPDEPAPE
jgi:S1-C subfamily serine protease